MKPYPAYTDSGVEWLGQVPEGWEVMPVKAVATCNDEVLTEDTDPLTSLEYVEIAGVDANGGIVETTETTFGAAPSRARRIVRDGDVLISTVRTYLRAIAQVTAPAPNLIASTGFAVLRPQSVLSAFLGQVCRSEYFIAEIIARSVGVSYPAINASQIMALPIPLPPLSEQQAIAAFLDRETAKIDGLIEEQRRLIALLAEKRQATISHAVTRGLNPSARLKPSGVEWLGDIPEGWEVVPLRRLFSFVKRQEQADLPVLSVYRDFGVILKSSRDDNINKTPEDLSKYQSVSPGDLVVNKMKAWQGSLGISEMEGITSPDYAVFSPISSTCSGFANHLLRCRLLPDVYLSISNGIRLDQWRLEPDKFLDLRVPVPPQAEQRVIIAHIEEKIEKIQALSDAAQSANALLLERRSALISAAVTGKIDLRDLATVQEAA